MYLKKMFRALQKPFQKLIPKNEVLLGRWCIKQTNIEFNARCANEDNCYLTMKDTSNFTKNSTNTEDNCVFQSQYYNYLANIFI